MKSREQQLRNIRILLAVVLAGLIGSGLSAFPLLRESGRLDHFVHTFAFPEFVRAWIAYVHEGLAATYAAYPFLAYGTDWLGFGHLVVALFVYGAFLDPVRNVWIIRVSMIACVLVVPTALICGAMRGIPLWWRAVDSSFGIIGFIPLWLADRMIRHLPS
jgi:hypothetical protein